VVTKAWAETQLLPQRVPREVVGEWVRFTLVYNRGAAFGMHIGEWSRWVFTALTVGALVMLAHLFRETRAGDTPRTLALGLVTAGAIGNLIDRLRSARGVVDFIDVGTTAWRFWTFNVADVGVSCGAVLLAIVLWREERAHHALQSAHSTHPSTG
jgi:signal peptidase II